MMQLIGSGLPFFGIGMRFLMWLYFVPMVLFFIGTGFARECLVACLKGQFKSAGFNAKQSVFGFIASGLAFSLIFYREDAFRCVVSLF